LPPGAVQNSQIPFFPPVPVQGSLAPKSSPADRPHFPGATRFPLRDNLPRPASDLPLLS
jgi:hypothetical protein